MKTFSVTDEQFEMIQYAVKYIRLDTKESIECFEYEMNNAIKYNLKNRAQECKESLDEYNKSLHILNVIVRLFDPNSVDIL